MRRCLLFTVLAVVVFYLLFPEQIHHAAKAFDRFMYEYGMER
jgi:hypothetical protein